MEDARQLGEVLKKEREKKKITVEEVYRNVRIHPHVVEDLENGLFDKHNKLYVKSFLKKYSDFLGLDTEDIIKKYQSIDTDDKAHELDIGEPKKQKKTKVAAQRSFFSLKAFKGMFDGDKIQVAAVVALSAVLVILFFVLLSTLREGPQLGSGGRKSERSQVDVSSERQPRSIKERIFDQGSAKKDPSEESYTLRIEAQNRVWLKVTERVPEGNVIFVGFLSEEGSQEWDLSIPVNIWAGKAEFLDFYFDSKNVGKVADGVEKNIRVSSEGIMVGGRTVFSAE